MTAAMVRWIHSQPRLGSFSAAGSPGRGTAASRDSPCRNPSRGRSTPIVTSRIVVTTVAAASFWNRVTDGADLGSGRSLGWAGGRRGHSTRTASRAGSAAPRLRFGHAPPDARRLPAPRPAVAATLVAALVAAPAPRPGRRRPRRPRHPPPRPPGALGVIPLIVMHEQVGRAATGSCSRSSTRHQPARSRRPTGPASVAFIAPGDTDPGPAVPATFVWAIEGQRGDYVANTTFPTAGDWKAVFLTKAPASNRRRSASGSRSADKGTTVAVGQPAPATDNPTAPMSTAT